MRVNQTGTNPAQSAEVSGARKTDRSQEAQAAKKKGAPQADGTAATANISSRAKDAAKAKAVASDAPDVREEKIAELRKRIASGSYQVDAGAVADRLVDEHIKTAGIG